MIERRHFLSLAAALPAAAAFPRVASALPDLSRIPTTNVGPVEVLYKTPHPKPNGLDITNEGLWIIDQGAKPYVSLVNPENGTLIREFVAEGARSPSGICIDGDTAWVGSTYNRLIVACDARSGAVKGKYSTPGAGQIYRTRVDQQGRRSPLQPAYPPEPPPPPPPGGGRRTGGRQGAGVQDMATEEGPAGTGAHSILVNGNLLYVDVPPARMIYVIDKTSWVVQEMFPTAGDRPHDMAWANPQKTHLWASESNLDAFFLHDAKTGQISRRLQLPPTSPIIHGAKVHNGYMYCCDDVGWMFRFRMPA